jgi:molecular chaperone GrpE (heat shock protein)
MRAAAHIVYMGEEINNLRKDLARLKKQNNKLIRQANRRGANEVVSQLVGIIDDCDQALAALPEDADEKIKEGISQLRDAAYQRFSLLGYESFGTSGDLFDPEHHDAVAVQKEEGQDGEILIVHRRGWRHKNGLVRPAMVSVRQNNQAEFSFRAWECPFGVAGCEGDCLGCQAVEQEQGDDLS